MLQLFQTILFVTWLFIGFLLILGIIGLIGAVTSLLHFQQGDISKLVYFDVGMVIAFFVIRSLLRRLAQYRLRQSQ